MKYVSPEMEIVEFDESVLTDGMDSKPDTSTDIDDKTGNSTGFVPIS